MAALTYYNSLFIGGIKILYLRYILANTSTDILCTCPPSNHTYLFVDGTSINTGKNINATGDPQWIYTIFVTLKDDGVTLQCKAVNTTDYEIVQTALSKVITLNVSG